MAGVKKHRIAVPSPGEIMNGCVKNYHLISLELTKISYYMNSLSYISDVMEILINHNVEFRGLSIV